MTLETLNPWLWDVADADQALAIADPAAAAAALNAQGTTAARNIPCADARSLLFNTGEYGAIVLLSRATPSTTVPEQLVAAAVTAIATLDNATVIEATDPVAWAAAQQMMGAFVAAGVLSTDTRDKLVALKDQFTPKWPVVLTADDITGIRALGPRAQ